MADRRLIIPQTITSLHHSSPTQITHITPSTLTSHDSPNLQAVALMTAVGRYSIIPQTITSPHHTYNPSHLSHTLTSHDSPNLQAVATAAGWCPRTSLPRAILMRERRDDFSKSFSTSSWLTELEAMVAEDMCVTSHAGS